MKKLKFVLISIIIEGINLFLDVGGEGKLADKTGYVFVAIHLLEFLEKILVDLLFKSFMPEEKNH